MLGAGDWCEWMVGGRLCVGSRPFDMTSETLFPPGGLVIFSMNCFLSSLTPPPFFPLSLIVYVHECKVQATDGGPDSLFVMGLTQRSRQSLSVAPPYVFSSRCSTAIHLVRLFAASLWRSRWKTTTDS